MSDDACSVLVDGFEQKLQPGERLIDAFTRLDLAKHELYCTVCENNTGRSLLHNMFAAMDIAIQHYRFTRKPHEKDESNAFYTGRHR